MYAIRSYYGQTLLLVYPSLAASHPALVLLVAGLAGMEDKKLRQVDSFLPVRDSADPLPALLY